VFQVGTARLTMYPDEGQDLKSPPKSKKKNFKANFASSCSLLSYKECTLKNKNCSALT